MNTPSADALKLAVKMSGHAGCESAHYLRTAPPSYPPKRGEYFRICEGCIADAELIDRELALPQRNAALRCAQGVVDDASEFGQPPQRKERPYIVSFDVIEQLRDALAAIRTK